MIRYNYRPSAFERRFGRPPDAFWDRRLRKPLLAVTVVLCVIASLRLMEAHRLAQLDADLAEARARTSRVAREAERVEMRAADLRRRIGIWEDVVRMQRATRRAANDVAAIGNRLPGRTWLTALRGDEGSWSIAGRSAQLVEIAALLRSIDALDRGSAAELVSVNATGHRRETLDFVIALERRR